MGSLRANFARLGNPMQDCHLRKEPALRACLPALRIIRGRSADNRKALLWAGLGPTSADLETLCRVSTKRRISVRIVSEGMPINTGLREGAVIWRPAIRRLSYWRLTGFRQNDSGAGEVPVHLFFFSMTVKLAAPHVISSGAACRYGDIGI